MFDSIAFVIFVGMIFYVIYQSVVNDDLAPSKKEKFKPAPQAHNPAHHPAARYQADDRRP